MEAKQTGSGIGFFSLLLIAFIVLKVTGIVEWSWWVVLIPLWIEIAILFILELLVETIKALSKS